MSGSGSGQEKPIGGNTGRALLADFHHPAVPLWTWDADEPRIRADRSYFGRSHVNDTFPGNGAVEWQWTLGQIVSTVVAADLEVLHLGEYAEPFWRAGGVKAAAWEGRLPNSFSLLARRR